jgi:t-SNARE complex subunit (syntaxin)
MNERELLSELNQLINVLQELVAEQKEMNRYFL